METNIILAKKTMSSLEIAELSGREHKNVMQSIRNMEPAWMEVTGLNFQLSEYKDSTGRKLPCYELTKREVLFVSSKFDDVTRAKLVLRWEDLETGKAKPIARNSPQGLSQIGLKDQITWVKEVKKMLNLNDTSTLSLLQKVADPFNLPLPDYTESQDQLLSATELLHRAGSPLSAQAFNAKMKTKGLLTDLERQSRKGVKKFKSLTEAGLKYGENQVNPSNPKETQPLYYVHRFDELLINLTSEQAHQVPQPS